MHRGRFTLIGLLTTTAIIALVAALPAAAVDAKAPAAPAPCCGPAAPGTTAPGAAPAPWEKAVGLTAAQKQRLVKVDSEWRDRTRALQTRIRTTQAELQKVQSAEPPDVAKAKALIKRTMGYQAELQVAAMEVRTRRDAVLTAQQREAMKKWMAANGGGCGCGSAGAATAGGCGSTAGGCGAPAPPAEATKGGKR